MDMIRVLAVVVSWNVLLVAAASHEDEANSPAVGWFDSYLVLSWLILAAVVSYVVWSYASREMFKSVSPFPFQCFGSDFIIQFARSFGTSER